MKILKLVRTCFFCFVLMVTVEPVVKAQLGVKGGLGISDIVFAVEGQTPYLGYAIDYMEHRNPLLSFQIGGFGTFPLSKNFNFQPELLLIRQGLDYDIQFLYDDITYQIRINYLHIPLLISYQGGLGKKIHLGIFTGPYASLKLKAVKDIEIEGIRERTNPANLNGVDIGVILGFSLDFDLPKGQLITEFRISYGLYNIMERIDGYVPSEDGPDRELARNTSTIFMLGYRFLKPGKTENK